MEINAVTDEVEEKKVEVRWEKARCIICSAEFEYPKNGYAPATCGKFECEQLHLHPELRNKGLINYHKGGDVNR